MNADRAMDLGASTELIETSTQQEMTTLPSTPSGSMITFSCK